MSSLPVINQISLILESLEDFSCVKTTCNAMFDETNGYQKEQVDLDLIDDEKALCDALQRMMIGDIMPQDPNNQPRETSPNDTTPPAQGLDQDNHKKRC
jgi:hypothetical protein